MRGKFLMRIALLINDLISWDRNHLLGNGRIFSRGKIISRKDFSKIVLVNGNTNFNGAALWYDALVQDTERLTMTVLNNAYEHGACIANYLKATGLIVKDNIVFGALVTDAVTGEQFEIRAKTVVNASGPWLDNLLTPLLNSNKKELCLARGLNIVVKKYLFKNYAIGLERNNTDFGNKFIYKTKKRFYFFVPWRDCTMIGTSYKLYQGNPDAFQVNRQDIEDFINEINIIYPPAELTFKDVAFFHAGLLPVAEKNIKNSCDVQLAKRFEVIDHEKKDGIKGLISVRSVKYTTAPYVAQKVLKTIGVFGETGKNGQTVCRYSINHNREDSSVGFTQRKVSSDMTSSLAIYLQSKYGKYFRRIQNYILEDSDLGSWISREPPLLTAEILYVIREEMAIRLSDVVFRRTGFGNAACPSRSKLLALADVMALELGWDSRQKFDELKSVFRCYYPLSVSED